MKKSFLLSVIAVILMSGCMKAQEVTVCEVTNKTDSSITFVVDENLPAPESEKWWENSSGDDVARYLLRDYHAAKTDSGYVASSFRNERFKELGTDVLYRTIVKAYAEHRPLVLSPDMIWLDICQVFSHYVNENAELLRDKFVVHDGKMSLVVRTDEDLLTGDADWSAIMNDFIRQIGENTKGNIAETFVADFSTTGPVERIASGITLMDVSKSYFDYVVFRIVCGIPNITLTGTPDDWKKVLEKTCALEKYGMEEWIESVKPVLAEFVKASEGLPNQKFWKDMVTLSHPNKLRGGGCSSESPTVLDGWFRRLFPYNKDGKHVKTATQLSEMLPEMVRVPFRYIVTDGLSTTETSMELWSGFVGVEEDSVTLALTPKIGWLVRVADTDTETLKNMERKGFSLRVKEVPQILSQLNYIESLELYFTDKVVLPAWMDNIKMDIFVIHGKMSDAEKAQIKARFLQATLMNT